MPLSPENIKFLAIAAIDNKIKLSGWFSIDNSNGETIIAKFWSAALKTKINFKVELTDLSVGAIKPVIKKFQDTKIYNKYTPISYEELVVLWPDFLDDLQAEWLLRTLQNK